MITSGVSTINAPLRARKPRAGAGSLTVACMTAGPGPRVAALLGLLRPVADEVLVALDSRADPSVLADLSTVADSVVVYPFAEPVDRPLPWLFERARCDWLLTLDDDEIPGRALLDALPRLCADERIGHYSIPRRWLFPTSATYLDDAPWRPDYQLRLVRTDPRLIRFSHELHRPIVAAGPGRFLEEPIWHADTLLRSFAERRDKARAYERQRPGVRVGARSLNFSFYLPENRSEPPLCPVPAEDRELLDSVLDAERPAGPRTADVGRVTREEIDACWPSSGALGAHLEIVESPRSLVAGEQQTVAVRVRNSGDAEWPYGSETPPYVRLASRWLDASGGEVAGPHVWSPLPGPLAPGEEDIVPVTVRAPERPGSYRIEIDVVHEHVRWLHVAVSCATAVLPRRRLAVVGEDALRCAVDAVEAAPELEIVTLRRTPSPVPDGYPEGPDARAYLFDDTPEARLPFVAAVVWRSARLLVGTPQRAESLVAALRGCSLLVLGESDGPPERREAWALGLLALKARMLGLRIMRTADARELAEYLGRAR